MSEKELDKKKENINIVFDKDGTPLINLDSPSRARRSNFHPFTSLMNEKQKYLKTVQDELMGKMFPPFLPFDVFVVNFKIEEIDDEDRGNEEQ